MYNYTKRHNEVVRCLHLLIMNKSSFQSTKTRLYLHFVFKFLILEKGLNQNICKLKWNN